MTKPALICIVSPNTMAKRISQEELAAMADALQKLVQQYGRVDDIPFGQWHRYLPKETAQKVESLLFFGMDRTNPTPEYVLQLFARHAQ